MSQRDSGYTRIERDSYETPKWVTRALWPHLKGEIKSIWEPAAGTGNMAEVFEDGAYNVWRSDISDGQDFLTYKPDGFQFDAIITNPPYKLAKEFIERALYLTEEPSGFVAMLLRTDYDHAKTRLHLFNQPPFAKKVVLTKRIKWFEESKGQPSFNHAWFIWDWEHVGPPTLAYGP